MTKEAFKELVEVRDNFSFYFEGKTYLVEKFKKADGSVWIKFGEQYFKPLEYDSYTHLMADAAIGTRKLSSLIEDLLF